MLIIRKEQMQALDESVLRSFEREMVAHCRDRSPRLLEVIGEEQMLKTVRLGIDRAKKYHFTYRGPVRLYIELTLLFGSFFDTDPQYPWAGEILRENDNQEHQMVVAERLHNETNRYLDEVHGPENKNLWRALVTISTLSQDTFIAPGGDFEREMLRLMRPIFPEKVAFGGESSIRSLIRAGAGDAKKYALGGDRGVGLMCVLMFGFGHGCAEDPLYPWIQRTLKDPKIVDADARTRRLEQKATTWLDHVLAGREGEE